MTYFFMNPYVPMYITIRAYNMYVCMYVIMRILKLFSFLSL